MSSPDAALAQLGMEPAPEGIEQVQQSIEPAPDIPRGASTVATIASGDTPSRGSAVTFDRATAATDRTPGGTRKVNREDVRAVFHASTTTGRVTIKQIQRIKMMHDKIADGVDFDFNYCCLLMVASIIAALGLALDSSTTVISSMLLSPIM